MEFRMLNRYLPAIVLVVVSFIGLGMTYIVYRAETISNLTRFEIIADDTADRIHERVEQHIGLLIATHAFFDGQLQTVTRDSFKTFVNGMSRRRQFEGLRGIGYARLIPAGSEALAEADLRRNYDLKKSIWPATDQSLRTPIVLLEPSDQRNAVALGYDMFSEQLRRTAMEAALRTGDIGVSAPVELVQEITDVKQAGFLVYVPYYDRSAPIFGSEGGKLEAQGFIYAPFRAGDLHVAALERTPALPVVVETRDTTDKGEGALLYRSPDYDAVRDTSTFGLTRLFNVGGREWTVTIHETPAFKVTNQNLNSIILGTISILLAAALAASAWFQSRAVHAAQEVHSVTMKTMQEKDLMLQEMKHRIKNSIARVLAIARQTAVHSSSLDEFSTSFSARMNAMANAQDMLTRSHWQRADLHALLNNELGQVFGKALGVDRIDGPTVSLDERTTQALGLTFHELATNALKYGGISDDEGDLEVSWDVARESGKKILTLEWCETSSKPVEPPTRKGFGTRLIDANIRGELGGRIERNFEESGMTVKMIIPLG